MSYNNYEDFEDQMDDILSSGRGEFNKFHKKEIKKLFNGMDKEVVLNDLNIYYNATDVNTIMEGELESVAKLIKSDVSTKIVFE